jgi:predicted enzyme related to lactoylglutathione lyase
LSVALECTRLASAVRASVAYRGLRAAGAQVGDTTEDTPDGRFGRAADPEGNRFELWQPPS